MRWVSSLACARARVSGAGGTINGNGNVINTVTLEKLEQCPCEDGCASQYAACWLAWSIQQTTVLYDKACPSPALETRVSCLLLRERDASRWKMPKPVCRQAVQGFVDGGGVVRRAGP